VESDLSRVVEVRYRYTLQEYVAWMRVYLVRTIAVRLGALVAVVLIALGLGTPHLLGKIASTAVLMGVVMLVALAGGFYIIPARQFRKHPAVRAEFVARASEKGVTFHTADGVAELGWGDFVRIVRTPAAIMFYYTPTLFTYVPRRAFATPEDEADFWKLVETGVETQAEASAN